MFRSKRVRRQATSRDVSDAELETGDRSSDARRPSRPRGHGALPDGWHRSPGGDVAARSIGSPWRPFAAAALVWVLIGTMPAGAQQSGADPIQYRLPTDAVEDLAQRTEKTKSFVLANHQRVAISRGRPLHYRDAAGGPW